MHGRAALSFWLPAVLACCVPGCGTTRITDTQRTATEQLLISGAVDDAVARLDFHALAGRAVFLDVQYLDGCVDRGYLVSSLRQQLLGAGCLIQEERAKADYIVEARTGGVGTDREALLVGIPQMSVPTLVPGVPSQIPEVPFAKWTDQHGVAKVSVFAYNRLSGRPVWQSGMIEAVSTAKDVWVLGAGPFEHGTIRPHTEFAGRKLPFTDDEESDEKAVARLTQAYTWPEPPGARPEVAKPGAVAAALALAPPQSLGALLSAPAAPLATRNAEDRELFQALVRGTTPATPAAAAARPAPPPTPNAGGAAESQPSRALFSAHGLMPDIAP